MHIRVWSCSNMHESVQRWFIDDWFCDTQQKIIMSDSTLIFCDDKNAKEQKFCNNRLWVQSTMNQFRLHSIPLNREKAILDCLNLKKSTNRKRLNIRGLWIQKETTANLFSTKSGWISHKSIVKSIKNCIAMVPKWSNEIGFSWFSELENSKSMYS